MKKRIIATFLAVAMVVGTFVSVSAVNESADTNLLKGIGFDYSFEDGTYAPEGWTQGQISTDASHTGDKSLLKKDSWGPGAHVGFFGLKLVKDKEYTFSFWFYSESGSNSTCTLSSTSDGMLAIDPATGCNIEYGAVTGQFDGNDKLNKYIWTSNDADGLWPGKNAGAWTYVERTLKPTEDLKGFKLVFSGEGPVYYDDFCLVEAPAPEATPVVEDTSTPVVDYPWWDWDPTATAAPVDITPVATAAATVGPTVTDTPLPGGVSGNFQYKRTGNKISITKYLGKESIVDIPEKINGSTVISIGESAFKNNESVQSIILPDTIEEIGANAFNSCALLSNVSFKENLKIIGKRAFFNCQSLTMVIIPESVTSIGQYAFGYDNSYNTILGFTITGFENTAAEQYANEHGLNFNSLGSSTIAKKITIKFTKKSVKLKKGWKITLKVKLTGAKKAKFTTSKKKVAKILRKSAKKVVVKGLRKGKATITAKAAGKKAKCKVTVR